MTVTDEHNLPLFGDEQAHQLLDQVDDIPSDELLARWPERLAGLFNVLEVEMARNGLEKERCTQLAAKCASAIAWSLGGRAVYLPNGDAIKTALRDNLIFAEFTGQNIEQLSHRYKLSHPAIYKIIAKQRKLLTIRLQPDMFA